MFQTPVVKMEQIEFQFKINQFNIFNKIMIKMKQIELKSKDNQSYNNLKLYTFNLIKFNNH